MINAISFILYLIGVLTLVIWPLTFIYSFKFKINFIYRVYIAFHWAVLIIFSYNQYLEEVNSNKFPLRNKK